MPPVVRRLPAYEPPVGGAVPLPRPRPRPVWVPEPDPPSPALDPLRLVGAVLEVLDGRRPARLLREVAVPGLAVRLGAMVRARTTRMVRMPRVCRPSRFVAEMSATVRREGRVLAVACRVEHRGGRWWFTSFTVLE
ncbi:Rv3235 family protein [Lentzea sp. DG1S-22]|uniref:Rv3235 family protein n=1 Tax=Lentzea sp. DG1S-22 TaxID=3108822 RepID=UPI002E7901EA|nr:Rv3235 family protein [Lentzea sp. DG1S-22]WVH79765.1 Rv3235 family protein [Lentzea sp. DG1S-22]